jgi:ABC-type nitrate/sulfonate/bicarbonate transport system substrate-binding protein
MSKKIFIGLVPVIVVIILGICFYWSTQKQPKESIGEIKKEIILGCEISFLTAPVLVAENKDYFQEEGIDVKIKEFGSGKSALKAILNESNLDIVTVAQTPVVLNSFNRNDYAIIAAMVYSDNDVKVLVRKDKGINNPSDLTGKKVGTTKGSTGQFFLALFLAFNGLEFSGVEIIDLEATELPQALVDGRVDAISTWEPNILNAKSLLGEKAFLLPSRGIFREDFYFVAKRNFIRNNPEILKSFLKAIKKGEEFIRKNKEESISIVSKRLKLDKQLTASVWNDFEYQLVLDQTILTTLEDEARWAIREGLTDKREVPNYFDFIYMEALEEVKPEAVTIIK